MTAINVRFDTRELVKACEVAIKALPPAFRSAVAAAGRDARRAFTDVVPSELNLRKRRLGSAARVDLKNSGPGTGTYISAFSPSTRAFGLGETNGISASRAGGLHASSNVLSGGGSANLHAAHGFLVRGAGGPRAFLRVTSAAGSKGRMAGTKRMNTASAAAIMSQSGNPVRLRWEKAAEISLAFRLPERVAEALAKGFGQ